MRPIICGYSLGICRLLLTSALLSPRAARRAVRNQVALVCLLAGGLSDAPPNTPGHEPPRHPPDISGRRAAAEYRKRAYPLGFLPSGARARALAQTQQAGALSPKPYGSGLSLWYNIGPAPITQSAYGGPAGLCSGRVAALAVDPLNPTTRWLIGAAQGGIWETSDGGASWTPRTDDQASLAMGVIAFAPSEPATVYAGTGEPNFRGDDYAGAGLLVSHNHGVNWQMLNTQFAETSFSGIQVNPTVSSNLVVATVRGGGGITDAASGRNVPPTAPARGIFVSSDGGLTFKQVLTGEATALQANPGNFNQQYGALGEIYGDPINGIYRTLNGWTTSELVNGPWTALAGPTGMGRIAMAIATSNPNTLYVGIAEQRVNYRAGLVGIWRTDNAWAATPTWTQLPNPQVYNDFAYSPRFWYHFYLLVDPADANALYLTELDVWRYTGSWSSIAGITSYYNELSSDLNLHPDNHVLAWVIGGANNKRLLLGNDGGLWLSDSPVPGTWHNLNNGLAITQIYRGAVDPRPDRPLALAGTQDNGTPVNNGSPGWPLFEYGDGGDCAISVANPDTDWAVSYDVQDGSSDIFRTLSGGKPDQFVGSDLDFDLLPDYQQFYVHFEKSPRNDDLVIAGTARLWRCDNFFSGTTPSWAPNGPTMSDAAGAPVPISAMGFAPTDTSGQIYALGTEDGQMLITTNGGGSWNKLDPANAVPGRYISGLAFSPADPKVLYVTLSGFDEGTPGQPGHLFKTSNALALAPTWVNVSPPVNLPLNCLAIAPNNAANIFVGSDIGVWNTSNGGSSWLHYGPASGMPNVAVYDLRMNSASLPTAFTHGRSAYAFEPVSIPILVILDRFKCLACPPAPCFQCPPDSDWLNPGDLVTVEFPLQNISPVDTLNLSATMLASAQITPVTGTQSYGSISANGGVASRAFQFIANYGPAGGGPAGSPGPDGPIPGCGSTVQVTLQLQDGSNRLGTVTAPFKLGALNRPLAESFDETPAPVLPPGWRSDISGADQPWTMTTNPPPNAPGTEGEDAAPLVGPANVSVFIPDTLGIGQSSLLSPPFPVATAQAQLFFLQAFSVSNGYDGCILEIALGTQPFQDITQAGGSFARDGYNSRLNDFNPLGLRPAWSGDSGGWLPVYVNLPAAAAGQTVQLRWHFANSRGKTNGFWFVDAAQVTEPLCLPPVSNPIILNPALEGASFTFSINTVTSRTYVVEYKTNLTDNGWQLFQSFSGSGVVQTVAVPATSNRQAFYRFRVQ